jgi:protoporphyrinogen oxidase
MTYDTIIIGAGPAGLTAGIELARAGRTNVLILEATDEIGGLSRTVKYMGNRIDIGGHRFFSKSDWVMNWWRDMLPVALPAGSPPAAEFRLAYQGANRLLGAGDVRANESESQVMLIRNRLSRIYFGGKFFDYPLKPGIDAAMKLGPVKCVKFGVSYIAARVFPLKNEVTLEDFFINRFGRALYHQFFKEYTEKVWGVPCSGISAAWGAQRVKSLSIGTLLVHGIKKMFQGKSVAAEQTSLIENFLYPKYGPGQMWETAADRFRVLGGTLIKNANVTALHRTGQRIDAVSYRDPATGELVRLEAKHIVSTMPVKELVDGITPPLPEEITKLGSRLEYRDFITVGVLYKKLRKTATSIDPKTNLVPDNWIYIQEPGVKVGRLQIFNNWSPYLVSKPDTVWVGLEFFAKEDDSLWSLDDDALKALAIKEMAQIALADETDVLDIVVIRMKKAYPGYYGESYDRFAEISGCLDKIENLFLIGRNGMHRYNNQDHSMLSAKYAVEAIVAGSSDKSKIWSVNIDDDYHEEAEPVASGSQDAALVAQAVLVKSPA